MNRSAIISQCGRYRYTLTRTWDATLPSVVFVMLNPSTANSEEDDPTIRKCIGFGQRLGFGGFTVVNLFAHRATDPHDLRAAGYPVGPDNDAHLEAACRWSPSVVCAWGSNAKGLQRPTQVLRMLRYWCVKPKALRINAGGIPAHPLMLPYTCALEAFDVPQ